MLFIGKCEKSKRTETVTVSKYGKWMILNNKQNQEIKFESLPVNMSCLNYVIQQVLIILCGWLKHPHLVCFLFFFSQRLTCVSYGVLRRLM